MNSQSGRYPASASRHRPEHLDGASLVFAATDDPAINEAIVNDCRRRNLLVCRADADEQTPGDFSTPALFQQDAVAIAVSAGGSPALAAAIRDAVARNLDPRWGRMALVMQALRPVIRAIPGLPLVRRREIFRDLANRESLDILDGGMSALWRWLQQRHPELASVPCPKSPVP